MIQSKNSYSVLILILAASAWASAQEPNPTANPAPPPVQVVPAPAPVDPNPAPVQAQQDQSNPNAVPMTPAGTTDQNVPLYRIQVVARDVPAINYFHRSGATKIGFQGTSLLPQATGTAKVDSHLGRTSITVSLEGISPANGFGNEYMTYVLWAITPEGRPVNLGEVLPSGSHNKCDMQVTTNLQSFGLIVTAEPYYAVTMPSDLVVMQNSVLEDKTEGVIGQINAHYSLLPRGAYAETAGRHAVLNPITRDERSPLELYEAVNAVQIAQAAGADQYAADTMTTAQTALKNAQDIDAHAHDRKETITYAREAVQAAEDARIITIRKIKAQDEATLRQNTSDAQLAAQQAQAIAEQQKEARAKADADSAAAQAQAQAAQAQAQAAEAQAKAARDAQSAAEQSAQQAAQQSAAAREQLKDQLNQVLQTKETARGLIINMSDVLFDFNKYTLKPEAREKLAKVSGILLAHPDLKLQVEGYTDNIGTDEYNQKLSEERADGVRDYLVAQSVPDANVSAAGYGKSDPVADNSTNSGRAENRRVQLVVSGASIGVQQSAPGGAQSQEQPAAPAQPVSPAQGSASSQLASPQNPTGVSNPQQ
jgi:outer membrane protein OmpA-like peptidoglycan-associated protein